MVALRHVGQGLYGMRYNSDIGPSVTSNGHSSTPNCSNSPFFNVGSQLKQEIIDVLAQ